jgi:uncharacterized protein YlxW (UPF0749 family)
MNPMEFVLAIIFMVLVFGVIKQRTNVRHRWEHPDGEDSRETLRLREEVRELQERLKVLERITVEKENSLAKEIESLRDR